MIPQFGKRMTIPDLVGLGGSFITIRLTQPGDEKDWRACQWPTSAATAFLDMLQPMPYHAQTRRAISMQKHAIDKGRRRHSGCNPPIWRKAW
jgi:hypothetical protein